MYIRNATVDDAARAAELIHLAQGKASVPVHGIGDQRWALKFYEWMFCQCGTFWSFDTTKVAVDDDDRVVGLISFYPNDKDRDYRRSRNEDAIENFYLSHPSDRLLAYSSRYELYRDGTPALSAARAIYIMNLAVDPKKRQHGIATSLLNTAYEACIEHSYECCSLHVEDGNTNAIAVFQRHGFAPIGCGNGAGCQKLCGFTGYHFMAKPIG